MTSTDKNEAVSDAAPALPAPAAAASKPTTSSIDPTIELHTAKWPPEKVNLAKYIGQRKVVLVGIPAAFTPT